MNKLLFIALILLSGSVLNAQCPQLPELSAFVDEGDQFSWDTAYLKKGEMKELLISPTVEDKPSFLTPFLVNGLRFYYPGCDKRKDASEYRMSVELYNQERNAGYSANYADRKQTIDSIIADFTTVCRNDTFFGRMWGLFMSGPYFGKPINKIPGSFKLTDSLEITVGRLELLHSGDTALLAFNEKGKNKWIVLLTDDVRFTPAFGKAITHYLGYTIDLIAPGKGGIKVHLDKNGRFRCYFEGMF